MLKHVPVAGGFALALGLLGGCAGGEPNVPAAGGTTMTTAAVMAAAATHQAIADDLNRLRALQVLDVGQLLLGLPEEATACYGVPCPGWSDKVAKAEAERAPRLAQFVSHALSAVSYVGPGGAIADSRIAADLNQLRALEIVEVRSLIASVPANNPNCYNLPCEEDKKRAAAENQTRAAKLEAIAAATSKD